MRKRPLDYYGPDDWFDGADPDEQMEEVKNKQHQWDGEWKSLPWWRKLQLQLFGFYD